MEFLDLMFIILNSSEAQTVVKKRGGEVDPKV